MRIFCNAGHHDYDPGVIVNGTKEAEIVKEVRNIIKEMKGDYFYVPDNLNLEQSIKWVNSKVKGNDLAIDIHLNANSNEHIRGTEAYYSQNSEIAGVFSRCVSKYLKIPNRGSKHDSETFVGELGWLRKIKCNSVVVELCYLTHNKDRELILTKVGKQKAALGIIKAINKHRSNMDKIVELKKIAIRLIKKIVLFLKRRESILIDLRHKS